GVLKAGGAYVPLDPSYPPSRLATMIEDVGTPVVLSTSATAATVPDLPLEPILLDRDSRLTDEGEMEPFSADVGGGDLAYVMFTSGSMGRPKGVCVPHRAIARLVVETDYLTITP